MLRKHLADAEQKAAEGLRHIAGQRAVIANLKRDGHDTAIAEELLDTLLESQRLHEQHRDRIKQELGTR